jgi:hypothetical protein
MFGVITANTVEQARERAGDGIDNKGYEAAVSGDRNGEPFSRDGPGKCTRWGD